MSRTKRKDRIDYESKAPRKMTLHGGQTIDLAPKPEEIKKAHKDKKKWYKPNKTFKKLQKKRDEAKPNQKLKEAIAQNKDFDEVVLPDAKKHNQWDWN